jgi:8-oxo-dGTP pyrophosphatase MutT (NUDIX family)
MTQKEWTDSVQWVGVIAGSVIEQDGKYLMVQEKNPKVYGLWNLPAGYVDKGEQIEHAAIREAKEETGFDVELIKELALIHDSFDSNVRHVFSAKITGGVMHSQPEEILDVKWFTFDEIKALHDDGKIRAEWVWEVLKTNCKITKVPTSGQ